MLEKLRKYIEDHHKILVVVFCLFMFIVCSMFKSCHAQLKDSIFAYIDATDLKHKDIVKKQALLESCHFRSNIFIENHNMFGMKVAKQRFTYAIGENRGHAVFASWKTCVIDYCVYQNRYLKEGEDYFSFLLRMKYAQSEHYIQKLKSINL